MPKPILSDSLFNADDVATAVLSKANLQIANNQLNVTDISSSISYETGWQTEVHDPIAWYFMGFVFININCVHTGGTPGTFEALATISDSNYRPSSDVSFPSIGYQGDSNYSIIIKSNGDICQYYPQNQGNTNQYVVFNGFYRP